MLNVTIVFNGRILSKKNNQTTIPKGNKRIIVPSAKYNLWEKDAIEDALYGIEPITWKRFKCEMILFAPDLANADLSNKWEGLADSMVKAGIVPDDNWWLMSEVHLKFGGLDRENPRAVVKIWKLSDVLPGDVEKAIAQVKTAKKKATA
mgnify:FL=1